MQIEVSACYTMRAVLLGAGSVSATISSDEARQLALDLIDAADRIDAAGSSNFNATTSVVREVTA